MEGLKVLSIGSDKKLFEEGSAVRKRVAEYAGLVGELHVVVLALGSLGLQEGQIAPNAWVYPTNSASRWLYVRDAVKIGKKLVKDKKFVRGVSLITTQDPFECGYIGLKIKKKWRLPLEVQLHTDPFSSGFEGLINKLRKYLLPKVIKGADSVRVVSESLRQQLLASSLKLEAVINVLPIYIDKERIENTPINFDVHAKFGWKFVLLAVARLEEEKNLGLALRVLAGVRAKYPDVGLVVVGAGREESKLKKQVSELGLVGHVAFEGWQTDLGSYYRTANLFIQTSLYEGYGLALIEAGLSSLPIISTPVGVAREFKDGEEIYLCDASDLGRWVSTILDLIENNHKRESLRVGMRRALEDKLPPKEAYLDRMRQGWEEVAKRVNVE